MADLKLADLSASTAEATDILYAVKDPSGTPLDRKIEVSSVKDYITNISPFKLGPSDTATPSARTLTVQGVVGGTSNTAGPAFTIAGAKGTGTGGGGNIIHQTAFAAKSTGTTQNTLVARDIVVAKGKVLTDETAASLFEIALPDLAMCGGTITATTVCTDGTDMQSVTQVVTYAAVNKGGTYTTDLDVGTTSTAISDGTLSNTWSILEGTNKITIQLTPDTSLTPSSNSFLVYYQVKNNSEQAITVL